MGRETLRFITCGSVDDGKSTLIGRLLHESKSVYDDQMRALEADSKLYGTQGERIDYFTPGELAALYGDWRIVASEKRLIDCRQDGTIHRHSVEQLVARAPADA